MVETVLVSIMIIESIKVSGFFKPKIFFFAMTIEMI